MKNQVPRVKVTETRSLKYNFYSKETRYATRYRKFLTLVDLFVKKILTSASLIELRVNSSRNNDIYYRSVRGTHLIVKFKRRETAWGVEN